MTEFGLLCDVESSTAITSPPADAVFDPLVPLQPSISVQFGGGAPFVSVSKLSHSARLEHPPPASVPLVVVEPLDALELLEAIEPLAALELPPAPELALVPELPPEVPALVDAADALDVPELPADPPLRVEEEVVGPDELAPPDAPVPGAEPDEEQAIASGT